MKRSFVFLVVLASLLSCSKDQNDQYGNIVLMFEVTYNGQEIETGQTYTYLDGRALCFEKFKFFMSEVSLMDNSSQVLLSDVAFAEFDRLFIESPGGRLTFNFSNIPTGNYSSMGYNIGIPPEINDEYDPSNFSQIEPLGFTSEYWDAWGSYIFTKIEGNIDSDDDGICDKGFAYHIGGNPSLREISRSINLSIEGGKTAQILVSIDLMNVFSDGTNQVDIVTHSGIHNEGQRTLMDFVMDNLAAAMTVSQL
jgi:hypothetical protein